MLSKIRHFVPENTLKSVYYATFSSLMTYGSIIWGQIQNSNTKRISTLQNIAVRIINFASYRHSANPLYEKSKILKFGDNVKMQNFLCVHDSLRGSLPSVHNNIFQPSKINHNYPTTCSNQHHIALDHVKTQTFGTNSIKYQATTFWNKVMKLFPKEKLQNENRNFVRTF